MITKQQVNKILKRNDFVDEKEFIRTGKLVEQGIEIGYKKSKEVKE